MRAKDEAIAANWHCNAWLRVQWPYLSFMQEAALLRVGSDAS
jgi:hypothetical protein